MSAKKDEKPKRKIKIAFNGLSPRDWTITSRSVWTARDVSSMRQSHHIEHGATFPTALAEKAIKMYTAKNDLVFDPFLGVGSTLLAAKKLERNGLGIELYKNFSTISKNLLKQETLGNTVTHKVVNGDCRNLNKHLKSNSVQLTFTSPPYANFIQKSIKDRKTVHKTSRLASHNNSVVKQYGENPNDFGNLDYDKFLENVSELMKKIFTVTKPGGYNIWVVKDHRDTKHGKPFIPVHSDIANMGEQSGFLSHDLIVWDQNDQRSLVLLGFPTVFYANINHSYLVILRKPPIKKA
jgi:DNA modification methylase